MPDPDSVAIAATGAVMPATGRTIKRVSELRALFANPALADAHGDTVAYEVNEVRHDGCDLAFGTTVLAAGRVGDEYFFTRGHFHARPDRGEVYHTQSGEGVLLLHDRAGARRALAMRAGQCAQIPPGWAHRTVNTGAAPLVFVWVCAADAGQEYGEIARRGMRQLVVARDGRPVVIDNPAYGG
jgi:glucose-6-phosphate isomerase